MKRKHDHGFPARDAIVAFIRAHPGKVGTREMGDAVVAAITKKTTKG